MARPTRPEIASADFHDLYIVKRLTMQEIADLLGCTQANVLYHLRRLGIKTRSRAEAPRSRGPWSAAEREAQMHVRSTPEYREKLATAKRGDKAPGWKGGVSAASHLWCSSWEWRQRRKECYARDNWTCQDCAAKCHNGIRIQAHHIIPRRHGGTDELSNLVTLCASCHQRRERRYADALFA